MKKNTLVLGLLVMMLGLAVAAHATLVSPRQFAKTSPHVLA